VACGGHTNTFPAPGPVRAIPASIKNPVAALKGSLGGPIPVTYHHRSIALLYRRLTGGGTVGDVAALDGNPFGPIGWSYSGANLDPSCGSLTWTYTTSVPGATVTWNPNPPATSLTGTEDVTLNVQPKTAVGQYPDTIAGHCTNPNGLGPK